MNKEADVANRMIQIFFLLAIKRIVKTDRVKMSKKYIPLKKYANPEANGLLVKIKSNEKKFLNSTKINGRAKKPIRPITI